MMQDPTFADLLNDYLAGRGQSPQWLATRLKMNPGTVSRWLSGQTLPHDADTILRIADILGVYNPGEREALCTAAGKAYPASRKVPVAETDEKADPVVESFRLHLNSVLLSMIDAAPERIAEKLYERLHPYEREVAGPGFSLYPPSCGDKGLALAHRRLFLARAFGTYLTGLLERDNIYTPIAEQIESPVVFGQAGLAPLSRILRALEHPKGPRVVVIAADGGMGKSTLAAKIVRCLYEQQLTDLILGDSAKTERVDPVSGALEALDPSYADPHSFYTKLSAQLGLPSQDEGEKERQLRTLIRNRLTGRRAVLVLDNLETVRHGSELLRQLRLLSSRDVRIIVTTRNVEGLRSLAYKTLVVHLRPIASAASCRTFLAWHVEHFQEEYGDLRNLQIDHIGDARLEALLARTGGIPLLLQLIISTVARSSWAYVDLLPSLFGEALLNFLYAERWRELGQVGDAGELAKHVLHWVARQHIHGEAVTFRGLDQWAAQHDETADLATALRLLHERFLVVNHDHEEGYLTVVPSLAQFIHQVADRRS